MGKKLPNEGAAIFFTEFNDAGEVIAFQALQNAVFAEGLWSKDKHAHLRTIWGMVIKWVRENCGEGAELFTMAADEKVARAAKAMGCEELPWKVFRRKV